MKKFLAVFLAILTLCLSFAGCGKDNKGESNGSDTEQVQVYKTPDAVAEAFIDSLLTNNYTATLQYIGLGSAEFVTGEDIEWYLPRSDYRDVATMDFEYKLESEVVSQQTETAQVNVTVVNKDDKDLSKSVIVSCTLNEDNKWEVDARDFYNTDYHFTTSGGNTKVYINDVPVSDNYLVSTNAGKYGVYKEYAIPYITKNDITIKVICENRFDYSETVTPVSNNVAKPEAITATVTDNTKEIDAIKTLFNRAIELYESGANSSAYQEIISSDADLQLCETIANGIEGMGEKYELGDGPKYKDFVMTQCLDNPDAETYYLTDDLVLVNFRYELSYYYRLGSSTQNMHRYSYITLKLEDGEYKIYSLNDPKLFTYRNNFTMEWK